MWSIYPSTEASLTHTHTLSHKRIHTHTTYQPPSPSLGRGLCSLSERTRSLGYRPPSRQLSHPQTFLPLATPTLKRSSSKASWRKRVNIRHIFQRLTASSPRGQHRLWYLPTALELNLICISLCSVHVSKLRPRAGYIPCVITRCSTYHHARGECYQAFAGIISDLQNSWRAGKRPCSIHSYVVLWRFPSPKKSKQSWLWPRFSRSRARRGASLMTSSSSFGTWPDSG